MDLALEFNHFRQKYAREFNTRGTQWEAEVNDGHIMNVSKHLQVVHPVNTEPGKCHTEINNNQSMGKSGEGNRKKGEITVSSGVNIVETDALSEDGNINGDKNSIQNEDSCDKEGSDVFPPQGSSQGKLNKVQSSHNNQDAITISQSAFNVGGDKSEVSNDLAIQQISHNEGGKHSPQTKSEGIEINKHINIPPYTSDDEYTDSVLKEELIPVNETTVLSPNKYVKGMSDEDTSSVVSTGEEKKEEKDNESKENKEVEEGNVTVMQGQGHVNQPSTEEETTPISGEAPAITHVTIANNQLIVNYVGGNIPIIPFEVPDGMTIKYVEGEIIPDIGAIGQTPLIVSETENVNIYTHQNVEITSGEETKEVDVNELKDEEEDEQKQEVTHTS